MDFFQKIAKEQPLDFRVFQNKKITKMSQEPFADKKITEGVEQEAELETKQVSGIQQTKEDIKETQNSVDRKEAEIQLQEEKKDIDIIAPSTQAEAVVISFPTPQNQNEEAVLRLEVQLEQQKTNLLPVFPIVRYLKNKCLLDLDFASKVNDHRKSLGKCFRYVEREVRKALTGCSGWLDDNEVYALAETYYLTDESVFEKEEQERKEAEKRRQEEVAQKRKEQEAKRKAANDKKKSVQKKQSSLPKEITEKTEVTQQPMEEQLSLI